MLKRHTMIYEHEIPKGSRLYFGKSAKLKRKVENVASQVLYTKGFEEIVTPYLSYHQHSYIDEKELLRFSDSQNHIVALRGDSTLDVVRIIRQRLGRSTEHKKWFYIQPVFRYPSVEVYQIGAEIMDEEKLSFGLDISYEILQKLKLEPLLQISHIAIPKILSRKLNLPLEVFKSGNHEVFLKQNEPWLNALANLQYPEQIAKVLDKVPDELKAPLQQMHDLAKSYKGKKVVIAPLFYAKMRYYDELFFRFMDKNDTLGLGGCYELDGSHSSGFGLYTDKLIKYLAEKNDE